MKKSFTLSVILLLIGNLHAQIQVFPEAAVRTGFLYELSPQHSGMEKYDGTHNSPRANLKKWDQIYFELSKSNLTSKSFTRISKIHQEANIPIRENIVPLGLIYYQYNYLNEKPETLLDAEGRLNISEIEVQKSNVFIASTFLEKSLNGSHLSFRLAQDFVFTNHQDFPKELYIDFDNGFGWQTITLGDEIPISYASTGTKTITLKATLPNGEELSSKFDFEVSRLETPAPTAIWNVQADLAYNNISTTGDAYVLLSDQNSKLTKPVIVCEGIDFEDSYTWETLYELFNQQNMLEDLRAEGYDLVVLNFHDPLTYIQSNAFLMMKLLEMVNDTIECGASLKIVGPSMGGMVTRYALTYMENNDIAHNCNLWMSFEAPHQGANIPLGLQYGVLFFKDLDASVQMLLDVLNNPAPKQMLNYFYTDPPTSPASHDNLFDVFQGELASMGDYPSNLRKIALSNGRGDAVGQPYNAGDQAVQLEYNSWLLDVIGNMWAVEDNTTGMIFEGLMDYPFGSDDELNVTVFSNKPYDNSPGGMRSTFAELGELELPIGEITVLQDNHAYIPTVSALDLATEDLFYNIAADPQIMQKTPFDTIFWSVDNYDHIYLSPETVGHIITEIAAANNTQSHEIMLVSGWNDLSSYIDPAQKEIDELTAQFGDELIILQHFDEVLWPGGGINTIDTWNYKNGYLIKIASDQIMQVSGTPPDDKTLEIVQGWNLIPVLCKDSVNILELLGQNLSKVKVIKEGVGLKLFWPEAGITTLSHLIPGQGFYLYANEDFILEYK